MANKENTRGLTHYVVIITTPPASHKPAWERKTVNKSIDQSDTSIDQYLRGENMSISVNHIV